MTHEAILAYCLQKPGAYEDRPFGDGTLVVKVRGRIFAQLFTLRGQRAATFSCDALTGEAYRALYPDWVARGYHCPPTQQPYFNTVDLTGAIADAEIVHMMDHAYDRAVSRLPKYMQRELLEGGNST